MTSQRLAAAPLHSPGTELDCSTGSKAAPKAVCRPWMPSLPLCDLRFRPSLLALSRSCRTHSSQCCTKSRSLQNAGVTSAVRMSRTKQGKKSMWCRRLMDRGWRSTCISATTVACWCARWESGGLVVMWNKTNPNQPVSVGDHVISRKCGVSSKAHWT